MDKGVRLSIAVVCRIRQGPDPTPIHHEEDDALNHLFTSPKLRHVNGETYRTITKTLGKAAKQNSGNKTTSSMLC
jgi:hypothetical protein